MTVLFLIAQISVAIFFAWYAERNEVASKDAFVMSLSTNLVIAAIYTYLTW